MTEDSNSERLTEAEWARRQASRQCSAYGHDWNIISSHTRPLRLVCDRPCGSPGYAITPIEAAAKIHDPEGICPIPGCTCDIDFRAQGDVQ